MRRVGGRKGGRGRVPLVWFGFLFDLIWLGGWVGWCALGMEG